MAKRTKLVRRSTGERQREIAEATLKLVAKYGVRGATVSRISAAVGLSRGALYRHFPNHAAVLKAAVDLMAERTPALIRESSGDNAFQKIVDLAERHSSRWDSDFESVIHPFYQFAAAGYLRRMDDYSFEDTLAGLVERGKRDGSMRKDVDTEEVVAAVLMFIWAEDLARFLGYDQDQVVSGGTWLKLFKRILCGMGAASPNVPTGES